MPNQYVNKVTVNGSTILDLTSDTVDAAHLLSGYTAHDASGAPITGIATSGGGAVTQDQDGYLVLDDEGGGGGGGTTGLEYESGTWTPNADVAQPTIDFVGTHANRPIYVLISDTTNTIAPDNSILWWLISSWYDAFSVPVFISSSIKHYAFTRYSYASNGSYGSGGNNITSLTGSNNGSLPTYLTNEGFSPYTASTSRYWRSDRTYKWIAVWAPTTS